MNKTYLLSFWDKEEKAIKLNSLEFQKISQALASGAKKLYIAGQWRSEGEIQNIKEVKQEHFRLPAPETKTVSKEGLARMKAEIAKRFNWNK